MQEGVDTAVTVTATDVASNEGTDSSLTLTIDKTNPVAAVTGVDNWATYDIVTLGCTDGGSGCVSTVKYYYKSDASCSASEVDYTSSMTAGDLNISTDHNDYLCLWVNDNAGNSHYVASSQLKVDTADPIVTVNYPNAAGVYLKGGNTVNILWTATDANMAATPITIEYYDGSAWVSEATGETDDGTYSWTVPSLNIATAKIRVNATDLAGNPASDESDNAFTIDSTAPTFSNFLKSTSDWTNSGDEIWIAFNVSETLASDPTVTVGTEAMTIGTAVGYDYNYTRTLDGSETGGATTTVSITGADEVGNSGTDTTQSFKTDFSAPTYLSNTYDTGTGILTITFNENLIAGTSNVDLSKIYFYTSTTPREDLNGSTVDSVSTTTVTITLSNSTSGWLNDEFASTYLMFDAGAVKDSVGNEIAADTDNNGITVDTVAPTLSSVTSYDYATRQLTLVFNEPIKYSLVNVSKITLGITTTGGDSKTLNGSTVTTSSNDETIVITLTTDLRDHIQNIMGNGGTPSNLYVRLSAEAVQDLAGNNNTELATGVLITTITHKDQIALSSGWNLISVPYEMDSSNNTFAELLEGYDPTMYEYSGAWVTKAGTAILEPLYGYLVHVDHSGVINLSYNKDVNQLSLKARSLTSKTWYTIGASTETTETASSFLNGTSYYPELHYMTNGAYNPPITRSGEMVFGKGYWLFATGSTYIVGDPAPSS